VVDGNVFSDISVTDKDSCGLLFAALGHHYDAKWRRRSFDDDWDDEE
jgi:hypothetical protein